MDLKDRRLWQIGAGDTERDYGDLCLRFDVAMLGPGELGPFPEHADQYQEYGGIADSIRRFYEVAAKGDLVLLRLGTSEVLALGEFVDELPEWRAEFGDIDGWRLQHVRRVRWYPDTSRSFPSRTLGGQVQTFAQVHVPKVKDWVTSLTISESDRSRSLTSIPHRPESIGRSDLGRRLFIEGLPSERVDDLMSTFSRLDRVATWYKNETKRPKGRPSEQETVAYLVLPLLFSLGWSQQTAAVEWNKIDVALFEKMPSNNDNLSCVVEAKLLDRSVFSPVGQARSYALGDGRTGCNRLIVTDGIRYTYFQRSGEEFELVAYLNLLDMYEEYPLFQCAGAVEAILGMAKW